ncbi:MAG: hypothetical protein GF341_09510 [candidate division Zixibacteria bacterium]|nr:hypothetical protein [candidate division Zixibacteria bacterium]
MSKRSRLISYMSRNRERLSPLLIMPHDYPDPDAIASAFALRFLASEVFGIRSTIAHGGVVGRPENRAMVDALRIRMQTLTPGHFNRFASFALLDTQPGFGNNSLPARYTPSIIIDQHEALGSHDADFVHIDNTAGATSVLLAQALLATEEPIPSKLATALVYGILSDTLNLSRAGSKTDIDTYLTLLPHADVRALARIQHPRRTRESLATLGRGIHNASIVDKTIVSHLGSVENPDVISQVADMLLSCEGMRVAFTTGRYKKRLHLSLRLATRFRSAAKLLRHVVEDQQSAGGHGRIAGGAVPLDGRVTGVRWRHLETTLTNRLVRSLGGDPKRFRQGALRQ